MGQEAKHEHEPFNKRAARHDTRTQLLNRPKRVGTKTNTFMTHLTRKTRLRHEHEYEHKHDKTRNGKSILTNYGY